MIKRYIAVSVVSFLFLMACSQTKDPPLQWKAYTKQIEGTSGTLTLSYPANWKVIELSMCIEDEDPRSPGNQCKRPELSAEFAVSEKCIKNYKVPECKGRHFMLMISPNPQGSAMVPWPYVENQNAAFPQARDGAALRSATGFKFQSPDGLTEIALTGSGDVFEQMLQTVRLK